MRRSIKRIRDQFLQVLDAFRGEPRYVVKRAPELPNHLKRHTLYLIGTPEPWFAGLLCPCGCGEIIQISLIANDSPSWHLSVNAQTGPTLNPSIWRKEGCRSHFFIRSGRIVWRR